MRTKITTAGKTAGMLGTLAFGIGLFFSSCSKQGPTGPTGAAGANGNANVTHQVFNVSSWGGSNPTWTASLPIASITATSILGSIQVYYSANGGGSWNATPVTVVNSGGNYFLSSVVSIGLVTVYWTANSGFGSDPNTYFGTNVQLNVVVIPPAMKKPNVNYKDYNEVKAAYNL